MPKKKTDAEDIENEELDATPVEDAAPPDEAATSPEGADGSEPSTEPPPPPFWSRLGDEFAELDEDTAAQRLQERLRAAEEAQQRERYWAFQADQNQRALAQREQQIQAWQQHQAQVAQQQQTQSQWQAPEYDPRWLNLVERNEKGQLVPVPGADPTLPAKIHAYVEWKSEQEKSLWQNPGEFVWGQIQSKLDQHVQQQVAQALQQDRQMREVQEWSDRHKAILFDPQGQPTQVGRRIAQTAQALGGNNPSISVWQAALNSVHGELAIQQAQQPNPAQVNQARKQELLRRGATQTRNRDGTFGRPETPRTVNHKIPMEERLKQEFAAAGISDADFN